jgi:hypothetical protein
MPNSIFLILQLAFAVTFDVVLKPCTDQPPQLLFAVAPDSVPVASETRLS